MRWKGYNLETMGEILKAVVACETREEAKEFMKLYRAFTPHADSNIGYGIGYYDQETVKRINDWCGVQHPIFGTREVTPQEAFNEGVKWGLDGLEERGRSQIRDIKIPED